MKQPTDLPNDSQTPTSLHVDFREQGIDGRLAAELRERFATFAEDWDAPEMDIYDEVFSHDQVKNEDSDKSTC